ncbi:MAG: hypothetical protein M1824_004447 [Vezdaea acicularis]|nr:MAG: hypothetical protein M1824_004447 [Vezdaea acicularis]
MPSEATPSKSGILTTDAGERRIPASTRPDGSTRKEIKIRPGYRPPEDIEVYKNRTAEAWKSRGSGGVPGASPVNEGDSSKASNKNAKRREARKKAKAIADDKEDEIEDSAKFQNRDTTPPKNGSEMTVGETETSTLELTTESTDLENERLARNLRKKLRQARELKDKKDSGANLLPEQFAKVIKINELVRQLEKLGFNPDEEP